MIPPIIVLTGPTATGKTKLALKLAKDFNGCIVNGDSRQVYKEMQIGTARPSEKDIKDSKIPHYLFGHRSIEEKYSVFEYKSEVMNILKSESCKNVFLVGGSGLYIDSVVYNYDLKQKKYSGDLDGLSTEDLKKIIGSKKLSFLNDSDRNNPRRLIRFIQNDFKTFGKKDPLNHLYLVYYESFEKIEENIKKRIDEMFNMGLVEENLILREKNFLETIGYREFKEYFDGNIDLDVVKEKIYINTRKYAKRQLTWFKRNKSAIWIKNYEEGYREIERYLSGKNKSCASN